MSAKTFVPATKPQVQKINILLRSLDFMDIKEELVLSFSKKRTTHISELSLPEAKSFIQYLVGDDTPERIRKCIISLGYRAGFLYGETPEDKKMNMAKLDRFLMERGTVKKILNSMSLAELKKVHRQFEAMYRNKEQHTIDKSVKSMLNELGIPVAIK